MRSKKWKAAFAALALSVALLAQPLTASAWMLDAEQQQLVDNLTSGQEALLLGNYAQAVNDLSRAVELNSNSVSAYYYRAKALQYMGPQYGCGGGLQPCGSNDPQWKLWQPVF